MAADISRVAPAAEPELVIARVFNAPRLLVFKAWTARERAACWWGPKDFTTISCRMDVRPGGTWRRVMRSPQCTVLVKSGVYREISEPERLVFTYCDESDAGDPGPETLVTVTFAEHGEQTRLVLRQTGFASTSARDSHGDGWTGCMERFAEFLAKWRIKGDG
ncbi:MAG: SRPBCC domain-containing protein [Acetobacteraceae bacterium]